MQKSLPVAVSFFLTVTSERPAQPIHQKKLNKNSLSAADGDDYVKAGQVMLGNGKNHYQGLSYKQRKKSVLGSRRIR